jgi:asparagine N-glycosylation enzyme membrane subunit Stt3
MVAAILGCAVALRAGMALRRSRRFRTRRIPDLRERHMRVAKPAVIAILIGLLAGPVSAVWLRDWEPIRTFHGVMGLFAAALFVGAAVLGNRLANGRTRAFDAHALLGLLAMLAALVAGVAGFVLLP